MVELAIATRVIAIDKPRTCRNRQLSILVAQYTIEEQFAETPDK